MTATEDGPDARTAAAHQFADWITDTAAETLASKGIMADVNQVIPGGASDGNPLVVLLWRGGLVKAAGYPDSYTPVVGHRVACLLFDNQLVILQHSIGRP